jgi:branched-chain amino acid transport system substrate-binding protein
MLTWHAVATGTARVYIVLACLTVLLVAVIGPAHRADSAPPAHGIEIAVAVPLSGDLGPNGQAIWEGIQLAIDEANASGDGPRLEPVAYDDKSSDDIAREIASRIVASPAVLVLGPETSTQSLAAGPVYAEAGLTALTPTATDDAITESATTFRLLSKNTDQGEIIATYLARVLDKRQVAVIVPDAGASGLRQGFEVAADRLGIEAVYLSFKTTEEAEGVARQIATDASSPAVVFLTLGRQAARILPELRRLGVQGPFLGSDSLGQEGFAEGFFSLPEEQARRGAVTDGVYALSPLLLDSANAETLAFAERFRIRFGHDPLWFSAAGYEAGRVAAASGRAIAAAASAGDEVPALRAAALAHVKSLSNVARALPGLFGAIWFDQDQGRHQPIRVARFDGGQIESAPVQIVPVTTPDPADRRSGAVFELTRDRYARLQGVVYTGIFVNQISSLDTAHMSFTADFYLWLRFADGIGPDATDPSDISFPTLVSGSFDPAHPAEQGRLPGGTAYKLWRVNGVFRNDYNLQRFPFDRQTLSLPLFNARAASDRIVYVRDRSTWGGPGGKQEALANADRRSSAVPESAESEPDAEITKLAAAETFRNLTEWKPLGAHSRRKNLVTASALGDPRRLGAERYREQSGFLVSIDLQRHTMTTLVKSLMPLLLMTMIMYFSLYFPAAWIKDRITVAITGALTAAVLLSAINSQLGGIGYVIAVEYAFFVFFGLATLCVLSTLGIERMLAVGNDTGAVTIERWTRRVFALAVGLTLLGMVVLMLRSGK